MSQAERIVGELRVATEKRVRALMLDITADLIEQTPVDTGWARANWIPSLEQQVTSPAGSPGAVSPGAQQSGMTEILGFHLGQTVYIQNNVPYIEALNDGHSPQAPAGFVDTIVARRVAEFNQ